MDKLKLTLSIFAVDKNIPLEMVDYKNLPSQEEYNKVYLVHEKNRIRT